MSNEGLSPDERATSSGFNLESLTRVLVVDDHVDHLASLRAVLAAEGFNVVNCGTSQEAIASLECHKFGVAVVDLRLPDGTGLQLTQRIKALQPQVRVIIYTAHASYETARDAVNAGAFAYVEKRGEINDLLQHVSRAIRDRVWRYTKHLETEIVRLQETTDAEIARARSALAAQDRVEQSLRDSEELYRLLAENARDVISRHTLNGICQYVSPSCRLLLGYDPEELIGRSSRVLVHPEDLPALMSPDQFLNGGQASTLTYRLRHKDGTYVWVEMTSRVTSSVPAGPPDSIVCISRDVSERKQAEQERKELEMQIQQSHRLESLGILAGGVAHDFNNLLHVILAHVQLAIGQLAGDSPIRQTLKEVDLAVQRAAELTCQMLACSGQGRNQVEPVNLADLAREMFQLLSVSIPKKVWLQIDVPSTPAVTDADSTQMRQVLLNLILNAADAIGDRAGVIRIKIDRQHAEPGDFADCLPAMELPAGDYVRLQISDSGSGIPDEILARAFEPFYTTKSNGRGMGLAVVLGIVRSHRGAIRVLSEAGRGTTFQIHFPASRRPLPVCTVPAAEPNWRGSGTALVIDDEQTIRAVSQRILEGAGFRVVTAPNGRAGLHEFELRPHAWAFVLLDVTMADMSGVEVFQELTRRQPDVRVLFTSGLSSEDLDIMQERGAPVDFIQKPYRPAELLAKVKTLLEL